MSKVLFYGIVFETLYFLSLKFETNTGVSLELYNMYTLIPKKLLEVLNPPTDTCTLLNNLLLSTRSSK